MTGSLAIPTDGGRCEAVRAAWRKYTDDVEEKFDEEIAHVTPDQVKSETAKEILLRRLAQYQRTKPKAVAVGAPIAQFAAKDE